MAQTTTAEEAPAMETQEMTVNEFRATQAVFPAWMEAACADAERVRVTWRRTFAGRFAMAVEAVR